MEEIVIRPSMKPTRAGYTVVFTVIFLSVLAYTNSESLGKLTPWVLAAPPLLLILPVKSHLLRKFTSMTISASRLHFETGVVTKSSRIIEVSKVQDVRIDQTIGQRIWRTGDLSIESAGETSLLTIENIDNPEEVAEEILGAARTNVKRGQRE
jgi:uncharacterized membrane protein YdbT with pleckstrin-like domain